MFSAILYSFVAAAAAMLGTALLLWFHKKAEKHSVLVISFSAGIMLAIAFTHLIPEGFEGNSDASFYILAGFLVMFFLQFVLLFHPNHGDDCNTHAKIDIPATIGLSFHSFIDGLIIAAGFEAGEGLGVLTTLAVLLHKLPDGITIAGILLHTGASKNKIFSFSLFTALFTPLGAVLGMFLFKGVSQPVLGALLAAAAGSFIFLAASDLIPETHESKSRITPLMLFVGVAVILTAERFIGGH